MGNRATVHLKSDRQDRGVYVYWDGGEGSIAAFLEETKKRMGTAREHILTGPKSNQSKIRFEAETVTFYATFAGVVREYFAYSSPYKQRSPDGFFICPNISEFGGEDNGNYDIENDFSCKRIDINNLTDYQRERYEGIGAFFETSHHAQCTIIDEERPHYNAILNVEDLEYHLTYAKDIAKNAIGRIEYLEAEIENLKQEALLVAEAAGKPKAEESIRCHPWE